MKAFYTSVKMEAKLFMRGFFGPFFAFIFPLMMLVLFGSIYGNEPSAFFGGHGAMDVSIPAYAAMVIGVCGLMSLPLSISEYRDRKIYKRFDATPVGKERVLWAQLFVNIVASIVGIMLLFLFGAILYKVKLAGNMAAVFLAVILSMAAIFSLGFFLASVARDAKVTNILCYSLYFIMLFTSGATIPKALFSDSIVRFSKVLPLTYVVELLQGTVAGEAVSGYWLSIVVLSGVSIVLGAVSFAIYKRKRWEG
jgi:ABC-2 type transport system permease protein